MIVIGLLSGTSVDAIDAAAGELHLADDGELVLRPLGQLERPWPAGLRERILGVLPPASTTVGAVCALDNEIGLAFAAVAVEAVRDLAGGRADLIATLGQTVFHDVRDGRCHGTLQLGQPAWIAEATGLPVVSDLRAGDVAAGGHGAPLAGVLDALWLAGRSAGTGGAGARAALNLGGIANATVVTGDGVVAAFDTGPANCLLDLATARVTGGALRCDDGGALARQGTVRADLLAVLRGHPYFSAPPPKSCGREVFGADYLDAAVATVPVVDGADLLATLTELTAWTVADALTPYSLTEVVVSGGGVRNGTLMRALRRRLPAVHTSDTLGLPADAKEAYLVALLGALTWYGLPGTLPRAGDLKGRTVTGARRPTILGRITPGRATAGPPTRPPGAGQTAHRPPTRLRVLPPR